ncbi:zonular occludens toxin domain-containing protein [Candidatus Electronema sp. JC]|uniref:zonular occludens toxin domain-containing protein n=1 Tax=Candidatus Electronema sp. JC TaxID=3401570 RepID=UPI003B43723E
MITAFTGTPGSGKSYDAVRKILDNLRKGRVIYTNIRGMDSPECFEMIKLVARISDYGLAKHLRFLADEECKEFWLHVEPGSLIVLDEVQNIFNARDWQSKANVQFNAWASTHRHHGYDVILITQSIMRLDTAVRALVEWSYVYRKINFFGSLIQQKYICYAFAGEDTAGKPLGKTPHTYDPQIFLCYQSYVSKDIKEMGVMSHVNVLKHPIFYAIPLVFCFFVYMLSKSGLIHGDLFGTEKIAAEAEARAKGVPVSRIAAAAPRRPAYSEHTPSIWADRTKSGQRVFSNRGSEAKTNNEKGQKNDAKSTKKDA